MDRDARLGQLASAILDGTPVNWSEADSSSAPADHGVVRQLQVVAEIAALHRATPVEGRAGRQSDPGETTPPDSGETRATAEVTTWGHLKLLERVGRGTYGDVYRAWDPHLDREVALKLLRTHAPQDDPSATISDPQRVVHEGRLLARVRHPQVITVYGAEPRDGSVGIWMEFIRGRTLSDLVDAQGPMSAREAAAVGTEVCRALAAVHGAGLLHRDVSARNVMREERGRIVLMDFGTGYDVAEADRTAPADRRPSIAGTPLYMAPELFTGALASPQTDVYAAGVLVYFLVTGRFPVPGRTVGDIADAHARGTRTRLRDARADLPGPFVNAVERAIAAEPAGRYKTAGEFEVALEGAIGAERPAVVAPPAAGWFAAAALIVLAAAGTWIWQSMPAPAADGDKAQGGNGRTDNAPMAASTVGMRKISVPEGLSVWSNPSDDGRFVSATVDASGDAGIADLATGEIRTLGPTGAGGNGYASITLLSPDASTVAVDWHDSTKGELHTVRADGSNRRVLVGSDVTIYQWSRDGSLILGVIHRDGALTIALVAEADGAVRPLRRLDSWVRNPPELMSLSPDNRYIAYDYPTGPTSRDREILMLDTHTGALWPLGHTPGVDDSSPLWSPDGRSLLFLSDRGRSLSLWAAAMENGRPTGEPVVVKDDVGRVWLRGFSRDGRLFYHLTAGFAEVYVAPIDGSSQPQAISPRQSLSNFYPMWSPDGRFVAYTSERGPNQPRELWVYDTQSGREALVPTPEKVGRPFGWSPDGRKILAPGANNQSLFAVDRSTAESTLIASGVLRAAWGPSGILYFKPRMAVLHDPDSGRTRRTFGFSKDPEVVTAGVAWNGRSVIALSKRGRVTLYDVGSGQSREWQDPGRLGILDHAMAPHTTTVAYIGSQRGVSGNVPALMLQSGSGDPRELVRAGSQERLMLAGWTPDGLNVLITRYTEPNPPTMWRVPTTGGAPVSTGLTMEGLRDVSIHPDGRRVAFNAGFKRAELWVMENLLAR